MKVKEQGRKLHVTFGDSEGEGGDALTFVVAPVNVETGAMLLVHFLSIQAGTIADSVRSTEDMALLAVGEENYSRAQELRSEEFRDLVQAAFFWNVQGGGADAVEAYVEGGHPKAVEVVFSAAGVRTKQL